MKTTKRPTTSRPKPKTPGLTKALDEFRSSLGSGLDFASTSDAIINLINNIRTNKGLRDEIVGDAKNVSKTLNVVTAVTAIGELTQGLAQNDMNRVSSALMDLVAAGTLATNMVPVVGKIGAVLITVTKTFLAPYTTQDQEWFLNKMTQCKYKKNTEHLDPKQAQWLVDRYSGFWGPARMVSDYAEVKIGPCPWGL